MTLNAFENKTAAFTVNTVVPLSHQTNDVMVKEAEVLFLGNADGIISILSSVKGFVLLKQQKVIHNGPSMP